MNLDELIENHPKRHCNCHECTKTVVKDIIRQALELAAERAEVQDTADGSDVGHTVNKKSILNVIKEVE